MTWEQPPQPGSARHAVATASEHYTPPEARVAAAQPGHAADLTPVPVKGAIVSERPRDGIWRTTVVAAGQARQLLPQDPQRHRAMILAVDNPLIICDSKDQATSPNNAGVASGTVQSEIIPANPAAGSAFTYTNNSGVTQVLQSVEAKLVTDATVANRFLQLKVFDGSGNVVQNIPGSGAIVASSTVNVQWSTGIGTLSVGAAGAIASAISPIVLQPGWQLQINVSGIDAGDQLSNIVLLVLQETSAGFPDGFYLPVGIALAVEHRGLAWVYNPAALTARISVLIERHENPPAHPDR